MPFDEALAKRTRSLLAGRYALEEKRMFGGLAFLVNGHMCCGIVANDLMVRVGPDMHERALQRASARPMDFTGRPLRGFVYVSPEGCRTAAQLEGWVELGLDFVTSLPPKPNRPPKPSPARKPSHSPKPSHTSKSGRTSKPSRAR